MTRYINGELTEPVTSIRKDPRAAVIPPFSFPLPLEVLTTGFWSPTSTMELLKASAVSPTSGGEEAVLKIWKKEPGIGLPILIGTLTVPENGAKVSIELNNTIVTPYDRVYIQSMVASGHEGIVVQMIGVLMT